MIKTNAIRASLLIAAMALGTNANAAECGDVTIADMNWASAEFGTYLDKFILENGYGCNVETVPGDTVPTITSMIEKGEPDIAPELWVNAAKEAVDQAVEDGKLVISVDILKDGGEEGWWIPKYTADKHGFKTVADVLAHPELFPAPEDESRGAFVGCPSGWGCQLVNNSLYQAFELDKSGFDQIDPGSAAGLDGSIAKAFEREQNWFGYYWAPTAILGKYEMVKLDFNAEFDEDNWHKCIVVEDCDTPKKTSWIYSEVRTAIVTEFADNTSPEVMEYLNKRSYKNAELNLVLAWMTNEQATGEDGALYFLQNNEDMWKEWVTADAAEKIKAAL